MKTKRELLLNTLSALNRMITLLFHLFFFSFLSSYGPLLLLLSCSASRLPGTTLSRALVSRSCVKKKGKIVEVSCVILLRRFPWRLWYWQRFNIVSIVGNFRFICFSIFLFSLLASFSSVVVQEEISWIHRTLPVSFVYGWWYFFLTCSSLLRLRLLMHQLRDSLYYIGHIRITLSIHLPY